MNLNRELMELNMKKAKAEKWLDEHYKHIKTDHEKIVWEEALNRYENICIDIKAVKLKQKEDELQVGQKKLL